jgi:large subunit ribosomal protein L21
MYAVVNSGGKQYKVQQGQVLRVEKISGDVGNPVTFERVLMFSDGENVSIGQPALEDVAVEGHIVEQGKAKKLIVFKYKKRKRYRRKKGHRQEFTAVLIDSIKPKAQKATEAKDETQVEAQETDIPESLPEAQETMEAAPPKETSKKTKTKATSTPKAEAEKETN